MNSEERQQKINELKALRAELMAYKESMEGAEGESNAGNAELASLKKAYMNEEEPERTESQDYEAAKKYFYDQYDGEENSQENQISRTRGR